MKTFIVGITIIPKPDRPPMRVRYVTPALSIPHARAKIMNLYGVHQLQGTGNVVAVEVTEPRLLE